MDIKPRSRCIIPASTRSFGQQVLQVGGNDWIRTDAAYTLGNWVTSTGEHRSEAKALSSAWSKAFWANHRLLTNRFAPVAGRMKVWKNMCFSLGDHRWPLMRPTLTCAEKLDTCVNRLCRFIVGMRPIAGQDVEAFCRDRNRKVASLRQEVEFDLRYKWSLKLVTWM